jgi:hypothetical protein
MIFLFAERAARYLSGIRSTALAAGTTPAAHDRFTPSRVIRMHDEHGA